MEEAGRNKKEKSIKPSGLNERWSLISRLSNIDGSVLIENSAIRLAVVENLYENLLPSEIMQVILSIFCENRSTCGRSRF
jgi:hypothetical protein